MKKVFLLISLLMLVTISVNGCGQAKKEENRDVKEQQAEDKDLSKFAGDWYVDGSLENGYLSISPDGKVESYRSTAVRTVRSTMSGQITVPVAISAATIRLSKRQNEKSFGVV